MTTKAHKNTPTVYYSHRTATYRIIKHGHLQTLEKDDPIPVTILLTFTVPLFVLGCLVVRWWF